MVQDWDVNGTFDGVEPEPELLGVNSFIVTQDST